MSARRFFWLVLWSLVGCVSCVGETTAVSKGTYQRELAEQRYQAARAEYVVQPLDAAREEAIERHLRPRVLSSTAHADLAAQDQLCRKIDLSQKNFDIAGEVFVIGGGGVGIGSAVALDQSQAAPTSTKLALGITTGALTVIGGAMLLVSRVEARRFTLLECQSRPVRP